MVGERLFASGDVSMGEGEEELGNWCLFLCLHLCGGGDGVEQELELITPRIGFHCGYGEVFVLVRVSSMPSSLGLAPKRTQEFNSLVSEEEGVLQFSDSVMLSEEAGTVLSSISLLAGYCMHS